MYDDVTFRHEQSGGKSKGKQTAADIPIKDSYRLMWLIGGCGFGI